MGNKATKTVVNQDCGDGTYILKKDHLKQVIKSPSTSTSLKSFPSVSSQHSVFSASRPWSRFSRRHWKDSTLTLPYELSKTAWPVAQTESIFLPEFPIKYAYSDKLSVVAVISKGSFGKVYKVKDSETEQIFALKVLSKSKVVTENCVAQVKEEVQIQKACGHHPFIINCVLNWQSRNRLFIVTEFVENGELWNLLHTLGVLPTVLVQLYVAQIALAIDFLHNAGVIHRDLKTENLLLDSEFNLKLIDFGLSKWLSYGHTTKTVCGTPRYMAPEILAGEMYGHAVDWWSLGVIACVMLTTKFPSQDDDHDLCLGYSKSPVVLPDGADLDVPARDLLLRLLEIEPTKRFRSLRALGTIAFFKGFKFENVKEKKIMPSSRKMILKHVMSGICTKMNRTKQLPSDIMETPLKRCLNTFDITLLGVGHMVGAGIYVLTGTVVKDIAGPGIIISFLLAGMACLLSALCYAEFGTRIPKAGSAYIYTYISVGEFWAFVIGWNILLEHMIGAASVARAWSGYVDSLFGGIISNVTIATTGEMHKELLGRYPDFLAFAVCIAYAFLLGIGAKGSTVINSALTIINLSVMGLVIVMGLYYANEENWTSVKGGFLPYGIGGVIAGAATCFYAFVGFDSIATSGEEATNPSFSIPVATVVSMGVVTLGYVLVSAALTLLVPYTDINPSAALPEAFSHVGMHWIKYAVSLGAICGMTTTLFGSLFSLPRCMYAMAVDGLLFEFLGNVNTKTQLPIANLVISGLSSAIIALLFDLEKLVEFMSIGTLLAYTIVSASVIILRYRPTFETTAITKPLSRTASELSASTSGLTSPASELINLTGTLRVQYSWLAPFFGKCEPGSAVTGAVFVYILFCCGLCSLFQLPTQDLENSIWWTVVLAAIFILVMAGCMLVITAHHQNTTGLRFKVPLVPYIPALSILFNVEFMVHLNILTWLRFFVWMIFGMLIYFLYGIHHSKEGEGNSTYSILMSSEAAKETWGSTTKTNVKKVLSRRRSSSEDIMHDED